MRSIVGRENELKTFQGLCESNQSEFVAVYGRRRVGKTFLIRSAFEKRITFQVTGLSDASMKQQLANFNSALQKVFPKLALPSEKTWFSAFQQLITVLEKSNDTKKIVFIDELPWFDTPKSGFIPALEVQHPFQITV